MELGKFRPDDEREERQVIDVGHMLLSMSLNALAMMVQSRLVSARVAMGALDHMMDHLEDEDEIDRITDLFSSLNDQVDKTDQSNWN